MKKRLFIYLSVIIGCLFIGLTTFYLVKNYEFISVSASSGNEIYLNLEETEVLSIKHDYKAQETELSFTISDEKVISFNLDTGIITGLKGGSATLTINSSNEDFGPFTFTINVGNGESIDTPYYIKNADDLISIGSTRNYNETTSQNWSLDSYYQLVNNIDLSGKEWTPIGSYSENKPFTGQFLGDNKTISNMSITKDGESAGMFAYIAEFASVESVRFENIVINGTFDYAGVVAGVSSGATISRIEIVDGNLLVAPHVKSAVDKNGNEITEAYLMAGGIVGCSNVTSAKETGANGGYNYTRTTVTMSSFTGIIGIKENTAEDFTQASELYIALGGVVGFDLGATVLNNKAEIAFNVPKNLADLSKENTNIKVQIGGIVGIVYYEEITEGDEVVKTIYPLVKNNLAIITCENLTSETSGVVGKVPVSLQYESGQQWVIGNYFYTENSDLTFGGSNWSYSTIKITTLSDLRKATTYVTEALVDGTIVEKWSLGESISVWTIDEGVSSPQINFLVGIGQEATYPNEIYEIADVQAFKYYYEKMTAPAITSQEIISKKFWLSQNYILKADVNLAEAGITNLIPIGYDYTFKGVFDGNGHKIFFSTEDSSYIPCVNNLEDGSQSYRSVGLFAIINTGAEVKNLTVEKFSTDYAEFAGGIAGINLGTITNCYITNIKIGNAVHAGFMVGMNKGIIQNTVESEEIVYSVTITSSDTHISLSGTKTAYVGGITGYNTGSISNIKISGVFLIVGETTEDVVRIIGGVVGYNSGTISNCSAQQAYLSDNSKSRIYVGGFCGINDGIIKNCYTGTEVGVMATTVRTDVNEGSQVAGGFVARLGYDGTLEKCFAIVEVSGYYSAGLAADLLGTASECYVKGGVTGEYIGGFACNMAFKSDQARGGKITNSYNTVTLTGVKDSSIAAGLSVFIRTPGRIENCFISNIFAGSGQKYYESYTDTRLKVMQYITSKISDTELLGTVNNIVINTQAAEVVNEEVKVSGKILADESQKVYYLENAICITGKDAFVAAEFSVGPTAYWTIEEGYYPILTNLNLDGISQLKVEDSEDNGGDGGDGGEEQSGEGVEED